MLLFYKDSIYWIKFHSCISMRNGMAHLSVRWGIEDFKKWGILLMEMILKWEGWYLIMDYELRNIKHRFPQLLLLVQS